GLTQRGWSTDSQFYDLLNQSIFLWIITSLVWLVIRIASFQGSKIWLIGISSIIIFDLFSVNWQLNLYPQLPEWHTQKPAVVAALEADITAQQEQDTLQPFRVYNEFRLYDNYGIPFGVEDMWGASPLRLAYYDQFLQPPMLIERAWAMLNVKYVITWRDTLYVPSTVLFQEPAPDGMTYLHRIDATHPRAWLVHDVEQMPESMMVSRMAKADFDPYELVLLPSNVVIDVTPKVGVEQVVIDSMTPTQLIFDVQVSSSGVLVLSEIDYPGWQAQINGQSTPILRANSTLRAIPISSGNHQVVITFQSRSFQVGAIFSAFTILGLLIYWVYMWQKRRTTFVTK
ncbi:MAG: YfhO family protein, partial [Chloroflexota bacterium]